MSKSVKFVKIIKSLIVDYMYKIRRDSANVSFLKINDHCEYAV